MARLVPVLALLAMTGCFQFPDSDRRVSDNPFGVESPPARPTKVAHSPASKEVGLRVDKIGNDILLANKQIAMKPLFITIGAPQPEVFHVDTSTVYVTEGLVKQCKSDAELAAVLSLELGKMVADREARTSPDVRNPQRQPPIRMPVGSGVQRGEADLTAVAEVARFEKEQPRTGNRALPRPDPRHLARGFLEKAGYQAADLDAADPVLQAADRNVAFERQFKGAPPQAGWR